MLMFIEISKADDFALKNKTLETIFLNSVLMKYD